MDVLQLIILTIVFCFSFYWFYNFIGFGTKCFICETKENVYVSITSGSARIVICSACDQQRELEENERIELLKLEKNKLIEDEKARKENEKVKKELAKNKLIEIEKARKEKLEKERLRLDKARHKKDFLTIIDRAEVARAVLKKFNYEKIDDLKEFLTDKESLYESVGVLHESLRKDYAGQIELKGMIKKHSKIESWDEELNLCFEIGEKHLLNSPRIKNFHTASREPAVNKNNIEKTHSWKELQDRGEDK
jgi:hypothetical protein